MPIRLYDEEFAPAFLQMLKKRDVLGQLNPVQLVPLEYNVATEVELLDRRFESERRQNPLLETTPPEGWLTTEAMSAVAGIRPNAGVEEHMLVAALLRYFQRVPMADAAETSGEQQLWTTVRPYFAVFKRLLVDMCDRRKSLRGILGIPRGTYTIREAVGEHKPTSRREIILVQGIKERWTNQRIARELDKHGIKPRARDFGSFTEMFRVRSQNFYALKSDVKRKYSPLLSSSEEHKA